VENDMILVKTKLEILGRGKEEEKKGFNYYILPNRLEKELSREFTIVHKGIYENCKDKIYEN
jgi:hypothetical protein